MKLRILNSLLSIICMILISSCEDTVTNNYYDSDQSPIGKVVTDNPSQILPFENVSDFQSGQVLKLRLNRSGTEVKEYDIIFNGIYCNDGERLIICTTPEGLPVGSGDSGSPVLTEDGKVVASLCYGWEFANNQFAARAIEDVLAINEEAAVKKSSSLFQPINCVQFISGVDENSMERYNQRDNFGLMNRVNVESYAGTASKSANANTLEGNAIPGMTLAILEIRGDIITSGAYGTVSYIDGDKIFAFGHEFGSGAPIGAYAAEAEMSAFIGSKQNGFKLAMPTERTLGTFTVDKYNGVLIDKSVEPKEFSHSVTVNLSGALSQKFSSSVIINHYVANNTSPDNDFYYAVYLVAYSIYDKFLKESTHTLSASVYFGILLKDGSTYNNSFNLLSCEDIDESLFYSLYDELLVYHSFEENIKSFNITVGLTEQ